MSWNRTYRPRQVKDLHLTRVREYFLSLLKSGSFPQAFLFTGSKGTGKTSTARIIGALLNDPANHESVKERFFTKTGKAKPLVEPAPDSEISQRIFSGNSYIVQELDAASNRGIDDVRALRERISLPPQEGLISVYILDEVHMLTTEAFNALLKLLEEPPAHVVFILATTELAKIPATIVSRCQVIQFSKATPAELTVALSNILEHEKLPSEPEVLATIAQRADGSFRDAVKLLEMIAQVGAVTKENAEPILQFALQDQAISLVDALLKKDPQAVVTLFEVLRAGNTDAKQLHTQLLTYLHQQFLSALKVIDAPAVLPLKTSSFLLKELADAGLSAPTPIPLLLLELKFLEVIERSQTQKRTVSAEPPASPTTSQKVATHQKKSLESFDEQPLKNATKKLEAVEIPEEEPIVRAQVIIPDTNAIGNPGDGHILYEKWQELLVKAVEFNFGLATLLKSAKPMSGELGKLTISVYYKFHQEQLAQPKFVKLLDTLFSTMAGGNVKLECLLVQEPVGAELQDVSAPAENLAELAVSSLM